MVSRSFQNRKSCSEQNRNEFSVLRRPKLLQPGSFEGPAAAWAPRRNYHPLFTFGLFVNTTFGDVPLMGLLSTIEIVPSG